MKYKHKLEKLEGRIRDWQQSGGMNKESGQLHNKPGSQKK